MTLAKVLRFYRGGVTVSDWDAMTRTRRTVLVELMGDSGR